MSTGQFLEYDAIPFTMLFDGDGLMTKPEYYQLVKELEQKFELNPIDYEYKMTEDNCFIVDVMAIRKARTAGLNSFGNFITSFANISNQY